ncbi:MAG TPA: hypothetical protein VGU01_01550 [Sphingomicrobium sp.]|nr:hypothetical protein [Sphingomicrobium sp.]
MKFAQLSKAAGAMCASFALAVCGSAQGDVNNNTSASTSKMATKQSAAGNTASAILGVNVSGIQWSSRQFTNLIYGSSWIVQNASGASSRVPANLLDANGWVKSAPAGSRIMRELTAPLNGGKFICRYQGNGTLSVSGPAVSNVATSAGSTNFTLAGTYPNPKTALLSYAVDPTNYIRNIDCRETSASSGNTLTPEFLSQLSMFRTIRFMKWQTATEGNWPVTWATRNKPGDGDYTKNDGVPVEVMVQSANQAGADLWVTVPWNADNDYITKFATYVRENLATNHRAYVEVSNEVWNGNYPVAAQATKEAQAEALPSGTNSQTAGNLERYAEKTKQVMEIWTNVFSGQNNRLVRVASWQHVSPYYTDLLLKYMNVSQFVDALATAPYFGYDATSSMSLDQIMTSLPAEVSAAVNWGAQQKSVASKYGLRYLTYEAGQGIVLSNNVPLEQQVQRDTRMHDAYLQFMKSWQTQIGDSLNLFALEGQISKYGAWGLSEYIGQPASQAPKLQAVLDFLGLNATAAGPPVVYSPTQVCDAHSIVPGTSSCVTNAAMTAPPTNTNTAIH